MFFLVKLPNISLYDDEFFYIIPLYLWLKPKQRDPKL